MIGLSFTLKFEVEKELGIIKNIQFEDSAHIQMHEQKKN